MTIDTIIYNTKLCINGNLVEAGLAIDNGRIVKVAKVANLPSASAKIDLNGKITLPGIIDSHVHLRDQQLAYKEDFSSGTAAAAAGGVTLVVDMPNNKPVTMDSVSLKERMKLAKKHAIVNVAFNSAFPKRLEEVADVVKAGAVGFKVYLTDQIGGIKVDNDDMLAEAFREAAKNNAPISVHAEDKKIIEERRREMEKTGRNDAEAFLFVHSPEAEAQAVERIIRIVKKTGAHVHFCHISSALGLDIISKAKQANLPVTFEVTPHHLFLSSECYRISGNFGLTVPPLRTRENTLALWDALKQGLVDNVGSDHAPHTLHEKNVASVWEAKSGIPGLETTLSLFLTKVNERNLSFRELSRVTAEEPAKIFNLKDRGSLTEGNWADLVVVDMKKESKIDSLSFFSKARYSPFDGIKIKGKPVKTFVNGQLVMAEGEIVAESGVGQIIGI